METKRSLKGDKESKFADKCNDNSSGTIMMMVVMMMAVVVVDQVDQCTECTIEPSGVCNGTERQTGRTRLRNTECSLQGQRMSVLQ